MSSRKVTIVTSGLGVGGSEVQVAYLCRGLKLAGWRVAVIALQSGPLANELEEIGVPISQSPLGRLATPRSWLRLLHELRLSAPDLVHAQAWRANLWGRLAAITARIPVVVSIRATYTYLPSAYYPVERLLSRWTSAIVTPARATAEHLITRVGINPGLLEVIPNGVDAHLFGSGPPDSALRRLWAEPEAFVVLAPGRLVSQKNHSQVIRAFANLSRNHPNSVLVIAGAGPLEAELRRQAEASGSRIHFVGELGRSEMADAMKAADAVCLTSKFEGMPNVLLEAMASSKPVVATAVDGTRELVEHGREGFLVPPDDDESLVAHLATLAGDPELRRQMGAAGRRRILNDHSIESNAQQHLRLYERVLDERVLAQAAHSRSAVAESSREDDRES